MHLEMEYVFLFSIPTLSPVNLHHSEPMFTLTHLPVVP